MEIIKWSNGKGETIIFNLREAYEVLDLLKDAIYDGDADGDTIRVEVDKST